jgi:hypothetical protein
MQPLPPASKREKQYSSVQAIIAHHAMCRYCSCSSCSTDRASTHGEIAPNRRAHAHCRSKSYMPTTTPPRTAFYSCRLLVDPARASSCKCAIPTIAAAPDILHIKAAPKDPAL